MNVRRVLDRITDEWSGAGFELQELESDFGRIFASVTYNKLYGDRSFGINVYVYGSGAVHVTINLGFLHVTRKGYVVDLLNDFNNECSWFKGYCTEEDENYECFVELHFAMFESMTEEPNEQMVVDYAGFAIGQLLDEDMANMIEDILEELD